MKKLLLLLSLLLTLPTFSQEPDDFAKRLKAITTKNATFYNIDGIDFSTEDFSGDLSEKGLKKIFKKFSINDSDIKVKDDYFKNNTIYISKKEDAGDGVSKINSYYFIENDLKSVSVIWFGYYNKVDKDFERKYVDLIRNKQIPKAVFEELTIDRIDFAGRQIQLGSDCYWRFINIVQCPYNGEMNWSVHNSLESAQNAIQNQFTSTKNMKGGKVISEELVPVIFEGLDTTSKKVVYDFTGVKSVLAGMSGGKTLTIYYVAAPVRDNYVSCVMSFWNNDNINNSGLAPLLQEVMQLKI